MMNIKTERNHNPTCASTGDHTMTDGNDSRMFLKPIVVCHVSKYINIIQV